MMSSQIVCTSDITYLFCPCFKEFQCLNVLMLNTVRSWFKCSVFCVTLQTFCILATYSTPTRRCLLTFKPHNLVLWIKRWFLQTDCMNCTQFWAVFSEESIPVSGSIFFFMMLPFWVWKKAKMTQLFFICPLYTVHKNTRERVKWSYPKPTRYTPCTMKIFSKLNLPRYVVYYSLWMQTVDERVEALH